MGGDLEEYVVHGARVTLVESVRSAEHDALVVLRVPPAGTGIVAGPGGGDTGDVGEVAPSELKNFIEDAARLDAALDQKKCTVVRCELVSGSRLVISSLGKLTLYDDVRSVSEAVGAGVRRARAAGARRVAVALPTLAQHPRADLVALLAALEALHVPFDIRSSFPEQQRALGLDALGVLAPRARANPRLLLHEAVALETARGIARDIGGGDPERMSPARAAQYVVEAFADTDVAVTVLDDAGAIAERYPLFAAVSRAADSVERHRGRIVFLEYVPNKYERTMMLVGKGVTYDTGGSDIKTGGSMSGMSRDKCGAAAVAGFVKACSLLRGSVKVVAALALVRNSVGEEGYVADELLRSRLGDAVRIGNTDAEGRLAMADLLAEMHERARAEPERQPHLYTVATLTGHAVRAVGEGYSVVIDNAAAREAGHAPALAAAALHLAEPLEVSTLRREDIKAHSGVAVGDTLLQAASGPSTQQPRGHQAPAAFLLRVAGMLDSSVRYSHLDVAGGAGSLPAPPTAAPLLALAAAADLITC